MRVCTLSHVHTFMGTFMGMLMGMLMGRFMGICCNVCMSILTCVCSRRAQIKADLEALKAPKRIDALVEAANAMRCDAGGGGTSAGGDTGGGGGAAASAGSVWNAGGTYEERDVSVWATAELRRRLEAIAFRVGGGELRVTGVSELEGTASVISNRGKVKRPFEVRCEVAWRFAGADPALACDGAITLTDIAPATSAGAAEPVAYEQSERFVNPPAGGVVTGALRAARADLQQQLDRVLRGFVEALACK